MFVLVFIFFYSQVNCFRKNYAYDVHENEEGNMTINSYKHQHTIECYFQLLKWNKYLQALLMVIRQMLMETIQL